MEKRRKLKESLGQVTRVWEELATKIAVDGLSDCVKSAFAKHENVLRSLENEFVGGELSVYTQVDARNCVFAQNLKDLNTLIHASNAAGSVCVDGSGFDCAGVLEAVVKRASDIDVLLEKLRVVKVPKEAQYVSKEMQTDNPQQKSPVHLSICKIEEKIDIENAKPMESPYNSPLPKSKERKVELVIKESALKAAKEEAKNDCYYPKYIRKEERKNTSIDLNNHLSEVARNIVREFKQPMKHRSKGKPKHLTNI